MTLSKPVTNGQASLAAHTVLSACSQNSIAQSSDGLAPWDVATWISTVATQAHGPATVNAAPLSLYPHLYLLPLVFLTAILTGQREPRSSLTCISLLAKDFEHSLKYFSFWELSSAPCLFLWFVCLLFRNILILILSDVQPADCCTILHTNS